MEKVLRLLIPLIAILVLASFVVAGDFQIEYQGSKIFTVSTSGDVNVSGTITQNGILLSDTYLALTGGSLTGILSSDSNISTTAYFVGSGKFLTGVTIADNSTTISYHNITDIPTCSGNTYLVFNGADLSCVSIPANTVTIAGENITSGTVAEARLPSEIYTIGLNATKILVGTIGENRLPTSIYTIALNASKIDTGTVDFARLPNLTNLVVSNYHNVTGIPTCDVGQHLYFDGTDLSCTDDAGGDYTNVAFFNQTNTWAEDQVFNKDLNVTGTVRLMSDSSSISRNGTSTNITIDSSGNIIISLG